MPPNARGGRLAALSALVAAAVVHPGQSASSASPPIVLDGHITLAHRDAIVSLAEHSDLYMCSHFPLQSLSAQGPLAVTHIAPHLPSATSAKAVHHVTIYACTDVSRLNAPPYAPFDCTARPFKQGCERMLYTWNDGMLPFELPEGKAMVMPTHALLQIHYKHPGESAAPWKMSDSSGMRMRVVPLTKGLRTYQFFELGPRFLMLAIPPHHPRYKAASVCAPSCIEAALGRHGYSHFEVISVNQHMHLAGSRVVTEVVHPNGSSTPFGAYPHFDFHKARMDMLPEPVIIRPGDALQVTCTYNTTNRDSETLNGVHLDMEMCFSYMLISPALDDFSACWHMNPLFVPRDGKPCHAICGPHVPLKSGLTGSGLHRFTLERDMDQMPKKLRSLANVAVCDPKAPKHLRAGIGKQSNSASAMYNRWMKMGPGGTSTAELIRMSILGGSASGDRR